MPTLAGDAPLDYPPNENESLSLAALYDRFAHTLDPFDPQADEAERAFMRELSEWGNDGLRGAKPSFHDFRKAVILRCRKHLAATNKPTSI